jgi:spore coat protein A
MNRRKFLKVSGGAAALLAIGARNAFAFSQSMPLSKFAQPLRGVSLPPYAGNGIPVFLPDGSSSSAVDHYSIVVKQYTDQLHPSLPGGTKLLGYADTNNPVNRHLGGIIIAQRNRPVQITFTNQLPANHILPVDTTIPGASLAQNRIATHIHGGLVPWISDGGPFDWFAPDGTHGASFLNNSVSYPIPRTWAPGQAEYYYPNAQSARLVWYHDHAVGITRLNAYAGIASGYIIRDPNGLEGQLIAQGMPNNIEAGGLEIPLVIQDKIFKNANPQAARTYPQYETPIGDLWYPYAYDRSRWSLNGTRIPRTPSCIAEFFGDTMLVNGTVYPSATIPPRRVRLRVLNACNARFLNFQILKKDNSPDGVTLVNGVPTNDPGPSMMQIGTEAGFLNAPVSIPAKVPFFVTLDARNGHPTFMQHGLLMAPAERADLIVDFSGYAQGTRFVVYTDCPAPFPSGDAVNDYKPHGNGMGPDTRTLMEIVIGSANGVPSDPPLSLAGLAMDPAPLVPPGNATPTLPNGTTVRRLSLNETFDAYGRLIQMLGTDVKVGAGYGREYATQSTENIIAGSTEVWRIFNTTGDTHPMHFHLINLQIISRQPYDVDAFLLNGTETMLGEAYAPDPNEQGWKETIRMNPGEVTTVIAKFDLPNVPFTTPSSPRAGNNGLGVTAPAGQAVHEYVWHCHILEHEEHDMMRPLVVIG